MLPFRQPQRLQNRGFLQQLRSQRLRGGEFLRLSFRNFACLVLLLTALAVSPAVYLYINNYLHQGKLHGCGWLRSPPIVCAHGGDSSRAPSNTLAAYQLALQEKVDCIEIDASRSKDGVLFALHDRDLQSITGRNGDYVGDFSAYEINQLQITHGLGYRIPTLADSIQYVSRSLKQVIIDAKVGSTKYGERLAVDIISLVTYVNIVIFLFGAILPSR